MYLPAVVVVTLLGRTNRRIVQMVGEFDEGRPDQPLALVKPESLPDDPRPARSGRQADYLSITDALRLVGWAIGNRKRFCSHCN